MKKLPLPKKDPRMQSLIEETDHKLLARWAIDCISRHIKYLDKYEDDRPRKAIQVLEDWISDKITMWEARKYCWPVLAFAREIEDTDKIGCQISRAVSHTLATCHVKTHAEGVRIYTVSAMEYHGMDKETLHEESEWQINHLVSLHNEYIKK